MRLAKHVDRNRRKTDIVLSVISNATNMQLIFTDVNSTTFATKEIGLEVNGYVWRTDGRTKSHYERVEELNIWERR